MWSIESGRYNSPTSIFSFLRPQDDSQGGRQNSYGQLIPDLLGSYNSSVSNITELTVTPRGSFETDIEDPQSDASFEFPADAALYPKAVPQGLDLYFRSDFYQINDFVVYIFQLFCFILISSVVMMGLWSIWGFNTWDDDLLVISTLFFYIILFFAIFKEYLLIRYAFGNQQLNESFKTKILLFFIYCLALTVVFVFLRFPWYYYGLEFILGYIPYYVLLYSFGVNATKILDYQSFKFFYLSPQLAAVIVNGIYAFIFIPTFVSISSSSLKAVLRLLLHPILISTKMFIFIVMVHRYDYGRFANGDFHRISCFLLQPYFVNAFYGRFMLYLIDDFNLIIIASVFIALFSLFFRLIRRKVGRLMVLMVYGEEVAFHHFSRTNPFLNLLFIDQMRFRFVTDSIAIISSTFVVYTLSTFSPKSFLFSSSQPFLSLLYAAIIQLAMEFTAFILISLYEIHIDKMPYRQGFSQYFDKQFILLFVVMLMGTSWFLVYSFRLWPFFPVCLFEGSRCL